MLTPKKSLSAWIIRQERMLKVAAWPAIKWAKKITLPGFDRIPIYDVAYHFWQSIKKGTVTIRASSVAFNLVLAVFPAIIFIFTLIPIIPIQGFQNELLLLIDSIVPDNTYAAIHSTIEEIITIPHGGLLSFGFFLALFFSTNGFVSLISAFNASVNIHETRSWWEIRFIAFFLVIITTALVTIGVTLIIFTQSTLNKLIEELIISKDFTYYIISIGKWVVIMAVFYFAYSFLFYLAPARKSKYRFISLGSSVAMALSIFISLGFSFYIDNFGRYNALYGSIGALPVTMIMVYLNCLAIIIGFELNAGILAARRNNSIIIKPRQKNKLPRPKRLSTT